jgi:hypothetical protein
MKRPKRKRVISTTEIERSWSTPQLNLWCSGQQGSLSRRKNMSTHRILVLAIASFIWRAVVDESIAPLARQIGRSGYHTHRSETGIETPSAVSLPLPDDASGGRYRIAYRRDILASSHFPQ